MSPQAFCADAGDFYSAMKQNTKRDIILVAALLVIGGVIAVILLLSGHKGSTVQVRVDGEVIETFSLSEDRTYEITGIDGGKNILIIENGEAWMDDADCPDKLCVNMGKISKSGQSVVCLPHKVVVEISDDQGGDIDIYVH